jgi:hypothetical protein
MQMDRSFSRVLAKRGEAEFFLLQLGASWDDRTSNYLFSAFASAARSVTFTLQAVCARLPGFKEWYAHEQSALASDALARFLLEARNEVQKVGLVPIKYRGSALQRTVAGRHYCRRNYRFVALEKNVALPSGDAVNLCHRHLVRLSQLVADCYSQFVSHLDPGGDLAAEVQQQLSVPVIKAPRCPLDAADSRRRDQRSPSSARRTRVPASGAVAPGPRKTAALG